VKVFLLHSQIETLISGVRVVWLGGFVYWRTFTLICYIFLIAWWLEWCVIRESSEVWV